VAEPRSVTTKMPSAMTARQTATPAVRRSPSAIESTAASAPSVDAIGATTPTLPIRSARYISESPNADPNPAVTAHAQAEPETPWGTPASGMSTRVMAKPISITQARAPCEPIAFVERDATTVERPHMTAAVSPARTGITRSGPSLAGCVEHRRRRGGAPPARR
jgi:hypothetical protein